MAKKKKTDTSNRAYNWFITINNYSDEETEFALQYYHQCDTCMYILIGEEIGEKCGTPHLHIYIELKFQKSFEKICKEFPRGNCQPAKGTAEECKSYCSKQNLIYENGKPKKQGERTDLDNARQTLEDTGRMSDVVMEATSYQSIRMCECYLKYHERKRRWMPVVKWFYGTTGTGKSKAAYEESNEDVYTTGKTIKWWEGYDANEHVIIDDFRSDFCCFHELLKLLDRYPYRVECKGGSRQLLATQMIITSAYHPRDVYEGIEDIQQLIRRITEIRKFKISDNNITNGEDSGSEEQSEETDDEFQ